MDDFRVGRDNVSLGSNLALVTNTDEHNTLSLYDIGRRDGTRPISTQELRRARPNLDSPINGRNEALEVTCASYSPDGNLIALGRNDSEVDVYDVRFLGERGGAWARISHPRKTRVERGMKDDYGCQHLAWVQGISGFGGGGGHRKGGGRVGMDSGWGTGLGLVTGASDGESVKSNLFFLLASSLLPPPCFLASLLPCFHPAPLLASLPASLLCQIYH